MKKLYSYRNNYQFIISIILVFAIAFLTIGFSDYSTNASIENIQANIRIQRDIRITDMNINNVTGNAISNWEDVNIHTISSGISLPQSDSTITYDVKIINVGNIEAAIADITGLPDNLTYTINNYTLRDMLCDDSDSTQCKLGSESTISITIGYKENGFDSNNTNYNIVLDFDFIYVVDAVAKVGNQYFDTLALAINAVPTDGTETPVILLKNTGEHITIDSTKNVILDLNNKTLSNTENAPVVVNKGILTLTNGKITTDAETNGAVNNESTGTIVADSVRIEVSGGRQALYNNKGVATITGSTYLYSVASERAALHNVATGTMTILSGTIISTNNAALMNAGSVTIGVKDGNVNTMTPCFQGSTYAINSTNGYFIYDGIVKAPTNLFNDETKIKGKEDGYGFHYTTEVIDETTYKVAYLAPALKVTFEPNASSVSLSEKTRYVVQGNNIGTLPTPSKTGYIFDGWFTKNSGGTKINSNQIIEEEVSFYAHWTKTENVAQIGDTIYSTIEAAIAAAPANTPTEITVLKDASEYLAINESKNIILNVNGKTLTNSGGKPIIESYGIITILNGNLQTSAAQAAVNSHSGYVTIDSCTIQSTSTKQAVYITEGTVEIKGNSYLSSQTSGTPDGTSMERGTVQNIDGTLIVTGGTIVGTKQQAISNEGLLIIGTKDGTIDNSAPVLIGQVHGIRSIGTFKFYDGLVKGKTDAIYGNIDEQEDNSQLVIGSETSGDTTYITAQLVPAE